MKEKSRNKRMMVKKMYESGHSFEEISKTTGYKESSIGTILNQTGVYRSRKMDDYIDRMVKMREGGASLREISEKFGFNISSVSKKLILAGYRTQGIQDARCDQHIDECNLVYSECRTPQKCIVGGKTYIDIAPVIG